MSDQDSSNPFDKASSKSLSSQTPPIRKFKRLNRQAAVDSDQDLFNQVELDRKTPVKEKQVFAKKLMRMFYDGQDEDRPKKKKNKDKKKDKKGSGNGAENKFKKLLHQDIDTPVKDNKQSDDDPDNTPKKDQPQQQPSTPNPTNPQQKRSHLKRKRSINSADFQSSVSDSQSLIPSSESQDPSEYSGRMRLKKAKKLLLRKKNEQKMKQWQLKYSVEQKDDEQQPVNGAAGATYYTGLEFNYGFQPKRDKNAIKSRNRMFGEFKLPEEGEERRNQQEEEATEVEIKVKEVAPRRFEEFKLFSKVSLIRRARCLQGPLLGKEQQKEEGQQQVQEIVQPQVQMQGQEQQVQQQVQQQTMEVEEVQAIPVQPLTQTPQIQQQQPATIPQLIEPVIPVQPSKQPTALEPLPAQPPQLPTSTPFIPPPPTLTRTQSFSIPPSIPPSMPSSSSMSAQYEQQLKQFEQRRNKESLRKMVTSARFDHEDQNLELEISVSIPAIARGKSTELLNSTLYLKRLSSSVYSDRLPTTQPEPNNKPMTTSQPPITTTTTTTTLLPTKKPLKLSRKDLLLQMQNDIKLRRAKFLSLQQIKQSFKRTQLDELQLAKQRMERKKNEMMEDMLGEEGDGGEYRPEDSEDEESREQGEKGEGKQEKGESQDGNEARVVVGDEEFKKLVELDADEDEIQHIEAEDELQQEDQQAEQQDEDQPKQHNPQIETDNKDDNLIEGKPERPTELQIENKQPSQHNNAMDEEQIQPKQSSKAQQQLEQNQADDILADQQISNQQPEQDDNNFLAGDDQQLSHSQHNLPPQQTANPQQPFFTDSTQTKGIFRKLKSLAQKSLQLKAKHSHKKHLSTFYQQQAQLGSDNEQNDQHRKPINPNSQSQQQDSQNLDADLEQLIDNAPYLNQQDEDYAYQQFLQDQRIKDKEEIMRVIKGEFRRSNKEFVEEMMMGDEGERLKEQRLQEMERRYRERERVEDGLYYGGGTKQEGQEEGQQEGQQQQQEEVSEQQGKDMMSHNNPFFPQPPSLPRNNASTHSKTNPFQLQIFSQPKSNSLHSNSVLIGLKNRSSLLSAASDKSKICSFEQLKQDSIRISGTKSGVAKLYEKNVMASKKPVLLGFRRVNSLQAE